MQDGLIGFGIPFGVEGHSATVARYICWNAQIYARAVGDGDKGFGEAQVTVIFAKHPRSGAERGEMTVTFWLPQLPRDAGGEVDEIRFTLTRFDKLNAAPNPFPIGRGGWEWNM